MKDIKKDTKKDTKIDYIPMVRAIVKLSAAIPDSDTVQESIYFKFNFKKALITWTDEVEKTSEPFMKQFAEVNQDALYEYYERFRDLTKYITIKNEGRTALIMLYCKAKSALNDLTVFGDEEGGMIAEILKCSKSFKYTLKMVTLIEKQYGDILNIRDADGNSIQRIIDQYDELGNTMFVT